MIGSTIREIQAHYDDICTSYINPKRGGLVLDGLFTLEELEAIVVAYKKYLTDEDK